MMATLQPEMSLEQQLAATIAMRSFDAKAMAIMARMAKSDKAPEQSAKEIITMFPTWGPTVRQIKMVVQYLRLYGEE